jgi:hypothetical protein
MSRYALALCLALAPLAVAAQKASSSQTDVVSSVAECLAIGLPREWKRLQVIIDLSQPLADTGNVSYIVILPDNSTNSFQPCDPRLAPVKLIGLRDDMPEKDRGWNKLILTMQPDASFDLKYEYPAPKKK